jgi:hypothetical protein
MNTHRLPVPDTHCAACALMPLHGAEAPIVTRALATGEELPVPCRGDGAATVHVVCRGGLKTIYHGRAGRVTISALHLSAESVQPSTGSRGRVHHVAMAPSIVRSLPIDRGVGGDLLLRLLDRADRRILRDGLRLAWIADGRPVLSLAFMLLDLHDRGCVLADAPDIVAVPMSRSDVASYLCFEPETISRTFKKLERLGLVERIGWGRVRLLDVDRLRWLVEI